jgi:transcriptional regulator with XRE-family HTH domain
MITRSQCRAARGLLDWTQQELANASGLSKTSINNYERGLADVKEDTLKAIHDAFVKAQVEFVGTDGVRKRSDSVQVLKGADSYFRLIEDIAETLELSRGELLVINMSQAFEQKMTQVNAEKMRSCHSRIDSTDASVRMLARRGDDLYFCPPGGYRWLDDRLFSFGEFTFVYGTKMAIKLWYDDMILIVDSRQASDAERSRFEKMWEQAEIPPSLLAGGDGANAKIRS